MTSLLHNTTMTLKPLCLCLIQLGFPCRTNHQPHDWILGEDVNLNTRPSSNSGQVPRQVSIVFFQLAVFPLFSHCLVLLNTLYPCAPLTPIPQTPFFMCNTDTPAVVGAQSSVSGA